MTPSATIFLFVLLTQIGGSAMPGSIEGTVCEVRTCNPISGTRLVLTLEGSAGSGRTTGTDLTGTFRFQQVPPGRYRLQVDADNYGLATIIPVVIVSNSVGIDNLKIEMRGLGTISGRAFDEAGQPLAGVHVEAMAFQPLANRHRVLNTQSAVETDDRGEFRISALEPGEYVMETIPPGDYTAIAFPDAEALTPSFLRDLGNVEQYERFGTRIHISARQTTRMDLTVAPLEAK